MSNVYKTIIIKHNYLRLGDMFINKAIISLDNICTHSNWVKFPTKWANITNKCTIIKKYTPIAHIDNYWDTWHISVTTSYQR